MTARHTLSHEHLDTYGCLFKIHSGLAFVVVGGGWLHFLFPMEDVTQVIDAYLRF